MIFKHFKQFASLLLIFLFIFLEQVSAQTLEWSISEKVKGRVIYTEILGEINGSYYIVKYDKKIRQSFIIEKFSTDMKVLKQYEFRVDKDVNVEKMVVINNNVMIFYSYYDSRQKLYGLFVNILDSELEVLNKDKFIASTKFTLEKDVFIIRKDEYRNHFCILFPDEIVDHAVYYKILILDNQANETFNDRMGTVMEENEKPEQVFAADSNILFVFHSKVNFNQVKQKKDVLKLLFYNLATKKTQLLNLYDDSIRMANLIFKYNPLIKSISLAGFYSLPVSDKYRGIAVFNLVPGRDSSSLSVIGFSNELMLEINGKNNENGFSDYYPRNLVFRNDGGLIFTAEYFSIERESYSNYNSMNSTYVKYYYQFGDMLILSVNPDGSSDWTKLLRKEQVSVGDEGYYSSFMTSVSDHKIQLLYNDINKNKWNLLCSNINPNGQTDSQMLVNGATFDGFLIPKIGKQVSDNVVLIPGFLRKKGFTLLKITF